jgi:putative FmdB family regulatory protein
MPTYDYLCDACNHKFEAFESINAEPQKKCPACKKNKLRRLFGPGAGIVFKGSGFYQTDYRSDSYKTAAAADKPAAESSSSDSGSKSDKAATPKPESKPSEPKSSGTSGTGSKPSKPKGD